MKLGKKLLAILLSILMLGVMSVPALAADRETCPQCGELMLTNYFTYEVLCDEQGYTLWKCATPNCGYEEQRNVIPALGHVYEATHIEGDCTHDTYDLYTCDRCGKKYKDNIIAAPGHVFGAPVHQLPTCTTFERDMYTCSVCGEIEYVKTIGGDPANGHRMELISRPETCADDGYSTYQCTVCQEIKKNRTETPSHTDADSDNVCDVCGKELTPRPADHGFFARIIRWITDIIEAFKSLLAEIKA